VYEYILKSAVPALREQPREKQKMIFSRLFQKLLTPHGSSQARASPGLTRACPDSRLLREWALAPAPRIFLKEKSPLVKSEDFFVGVADSAPLRVRDKIRTGTYMHS